MSPCKIILKNILALTVSLFLTTACQNETSGARGNDTPLSAIHTQIAQDYPTLKHITPRELTARLNDPELVLLDMRSANEVRVSHIDGAVFLSADIRPDALYATFPNGLKDKHIILYCSVGRRSSETAHRLEKHFLALGAKSIHNLEGGIFRWHNERRPLMRDDDRTDEIHPYNRAWGRYIARKEQIRYNNSD